MAFMADLDFRPDVYQIKQLNKVLVADSDATIPGVGPNKLFVVAYSRSAIEFCG